VPGAALDAAHAQVGPDTIAKFLFTSGSTKQPKGVINTHRMMCANQQQMRQCMPFLAEEPPVLVDWLPWNHTFGGNHNVGMVLYNGGTLYIDDGKPTPAGIAETLRNLREIAPTVYFNVPKGWRRSPARWTDPRCATRCSRAARPSCSPAPRSARRCGTTWTPRRGRRRRAHPHHHRPGHDRDRRQSAPSPSAPTCKAATSACRCRASRSSWCPTPKASGKTEIRFRGPNVMPGYWRMPEQTAEAFDDEGFYRTGDAVRWIDPADPQRGLFFDGRIAEDFKLSTGTFVSVGPLRAKIVPPATPGAGRGRRRAEPRRHRPAAVPADRRHPATLRPACGRQPRPEVLAAPAVRAFFQALPTACGPRAPAAPPRGSGCTCWPSRRRSTAARSPTRARSTSAPCSERTQLRQLLAKLAGSVRPGA
jgi:feruloyl-CoA synthase